MWGQVACGDGSEGAPECQGRGPEPPRSQAKGPLAAPALRRVHLASSLHLLVSRYESSTHARC